MLLGFPKKNSIQPLWKKGWMLLKTIILMCAQRHPVPHAGHWVVSS